MILLKERIQEKSTVKDGGIIRVDSFLNQQVDIELLDEMGREFKRRFADLQVDKVITAAVSGIAIGTMTARHFNVPLVFARKSVTQNLSEDNYEAEIHSYTEGKAYKIRIGRDYLSEGENILIIDDFLANGKAITGLIEIVEEAGANLLGVGVAIEKGFQVGGKALRDEGIRLESLAIIDSIEDGEIKFR